MNRGNLSRRGFMQASIAALTASGLPLWYAREIVAAEDAKPTRTPKDKYRVGVVGCGSPASRSMQVYGASKPVKELEWVAVCDVDARHLKRAEEFFAKEKHTVKGFHNYQDVTRHKDVDIVLCATPDHWHALVAIDAMRHGKDVYCEKPLTLTVEEARAVMQVAKETGRVLQTGSQQRSDARFRLACEIVRNGRLGKLTTVTTVLPQGLNAGPFKPAPVPKELDWDTWQGPTLETEYVPERCHFSFRYWTEYSGGTLTDWGAHHNDIALWGIGSETGPESVEGKLLLKPVPGGYTAPAAYEATFTYANGVVHRCVSTTASTVTGGAAKGQPGELPHGVRFEGPDGWLFVTRGKIEASKPELLNDKFGDKELRLPVSNDHMGNFFDAVKSRKEPICNAEVGHRSASVCHLAGIAVRLGRKLKWDPAKEEFVGDKEANALVAREQRKKWSYETI